jgi:hypothetical protein
MPSGNLDRAETSERLSPSRLAGMEDDMTSVPEITRILARIAEWQEGHGKPGGRAEAARRLEEATGIAGQRQTVKAVLYASARKPAATR